MHPRSWAEIDPEALRHNAAACRAAIPAGATLTAVVKADGYGHGAATVARALSGVVDFFGVASAVEADGIAKALGPAAAGRLLVLGPVLPEERVPAIAAGVAVPVSSIDEVKAFACAAEETGQVASLHAVVDTGMGRMGAAIDAFHGLVREILAAGPAVRLAGIASHFPSADEDADFTRQQIARFRALLGQLKLPSGVRIHLANSAGLLGFGSELDCCNDFRPGLALYGVSPLPECQDRLRPAMTWKACVALVRDVAAGDSVSYGRTFVASRPLRAATLSVGYADGYPRSLSGNGAEVLIAGKRCPLLGRVTMDQVVVDVSALPEPPAPGAEAVLMGRQGDESISAVELAEKAGTIAWEILTGISARVARVTTPSDPVGSAT